ncbi:MAG: AAA family ATPase [Planctomycetota bacterium]|nr:AAA family ATPase [Planctomycetota bacterium]
MTTADDAFGRLMTKNALNIPVANPSGDAGRTRRADPPVADNRRGTAIRVMDVMEMDEDYRPRAGDDDEKGDVFTTPTESDLDAVPDGNEEPEQPEQAAETRDAATSPTEFFAEAENGDGEPVDRDELDTDANFREADVVEESSPAGLALDRARRVRRFAYLPLAGIEQFELRARDIMAGLVAQTPEQPSLAVVGPARGDGQTESAIRLALAVAKRVDYRILLVDMDVRRPQVARRLGLSSKYFTAMDVLRGACPLGEALMHSEEDNLYVLPSRASDRDGDEVLDVKQVRQLMGQLHSAFDFVILCCGSMDHVDATILCRHTGATALAGFCRHTRASALRDAAERLAESGVTVAGLLLTGAA